MVGIAEIGVRVNLLIVYFGAFIKDYRLEKYFFALDRPLVTRSPPEPRKEVILEHDFGADLA
ncbi:MAG: hypothetical protein BMS9Abin05_0885 [Rhodothermia bacterium]|nr:MAG: hypothetical protein BMS9Abin05_0885 [Rhodothermia bacterium]